MILVDGKERQTITPILIFVVNEVSFTLAKLKVNGNEYEIKINDQGRAQMI